MYIKKFDHCIIIVFCLSKLLLWIQVEGVPALIHQTEVSWDATLDPASYFKVGQVYIDIVSLFKVMHASDGEYNQNNQNEKDWISQLSTKGSSSSEKKGTCRDLYK